jgi:hypothetical protein
MKKIILLLLICIISKTVCCQNINCKVMMDSLQGTYEGACENGKANGQGKAVGVDTYVGSFRKGFPDGIGKYTWSNGNYYDGNWKKGLKEGKGEIHLLRSLNTDSIVTGFWKKDIYSGKYEKTYSVENSTTDIGRIDISNFKSGNNSIKIEVQRMSGGGFATSTGSTNNSIADVAKPIRLSEIRVQQGIFLTKSVNTLSDKEIVYLQSVTFPFRATFVFGNSSFEIEFFENGEWNVNVPVRN